MSTAAISSPPVLRLCSSDSARDHRSSNRRNLKGNNLGFSLKTAAAMTKKFELNCSAEKDKDLTTSALAEGITDCLDDSPLTELGTHFFLPFLLSIWIFLLGVELCLIRC